MFRNKSEDFEVYVLYMSKITHTQVTLFFYI